jgi:hypothetical protein
MYHAGRRELYSQHPRPAVWARLTLGVKPRHSAGALTDPRNDEMTMQDLRKPNLSIESDLKILTGTAKTLNALTDELNKQVEQIEAILGQLNLGLTVWVYVDETTEERGWLHYVRLLYSKNDGEWGMAIDEYDEHQGTEERRDYRSWRFNAAPRGMRLQAVGFIPALLKELVKESQTVTEKLKAKVLEVREIASSLVTPTLSGGLGK